MIVILLTVGACVLVWGTWLVLRGSLLAGCVVYAVLTTCFGGYFYQFDLAGVTWTLDRLLLVVLVGATILQVRLGGEFRRPAAVQWLLAGLLVWLLVSTFTRDWRLGVPPEGSIVMRLANGLLIPAVIYGIARQARFHERGVLLLHASAAVFGVYLAGTALCEATGLWSCVFPRYIADPQLGIHFGRARGPALQAATNGALLVTCFTAAWLLLVWQKRWGRPGQLLAIGLLPLFAVAVFATYTRTAWLSAGLVGLLILTATLHGRWRNALGLGVLVVATAVAVLQWDSLVGFRREESASVTRRSTYMRASFAYVSWKMFLERPLLGVGFGQFPHANQPYLSDKDTSLQLESIRDWVHHNTALCMLVESGVIGFVLYLTLLGAWTRSGWQLWRNRSAPRWVRAHGLLLVAALTCYLCELLFHDVTYSTTDNVLVFLLAGAAASYEWQTAAQQRDAPAACEANGGADTKRVAMAFGH